MPPETPTAFTSPPMKKPKPRKAKRPAADAPPRKPRVTLRSRIEAMGPTHLAAYRILCDGAEFDAALRAALRAEEDDARAVDAMIKAQRDLDAAERRRTETCAAIAAGRSVLAKLDRLARDIATAREDVPSADDAHAPTVAPASASD